MPLQLLVSGSIVASMLLLALFLIGNSYYSYRATLIAASSGTARQLAENLDTHLQRLLQPIESTLRLLTLDPLSQAHSLQARRERLPMLVQALEANPVLSAVYAGYPDGSFLLLRTLKNSAARDAVHAPTGAYYMLQSVERNSTGERLKGTWQFFDVQLQTIATLDKPDFV